MTYDLGKSGGDFKGSITEYDILDIYKYSTLICDLIKQIELDVGSIDF